MTTPFEVYSRPRDDAISAAVLGLMALAALFPVRGVDINPTWWWLPFAGLFAAVAWSYGRRALRPARLVVVHPWGIVVDGRREIPRDQLVGVAVKSWRTWMVVVQVREPGAPTERLRAVEVLTTSDVQEARATANAIHALGVPMPAPANAPANGPS